MEITIKNEAYIDSSEVCKKIGVAESTLKVMSRAHEIPEAIKLKTMKFWKLSEIEAYIGSTRK